MVVSGRFFFVNLYSQKSEEGDPIWNAHIYSIIGLKPSTCNLTGHSWLIVSRLQFRQRPLHKCLIWGVGLAAAMGIRLLFNFVTLRLCWAGGIPSKAVNKETGGSTRGAPWGFVKIIEKVTLINLIYCLRRYSYLLWFLSEKTLVMLPESCFWWVDSPLCFEGYCNKYILNHFYI